MTSEVFFDSANGVGTITLNRPRAINALTTEMLVAIGEQLTAWADDDEVTEIVFTGAGDRGFCAGADIKTMRQNILDGDSDQALQFLMIEYDVNTQIANYPKPTTAFLSGVAMGGGLGLGQHTDRRLGQPDTRWAMPETAIGLWPDVGVTFEMSRAPGQVGAYLAMTGETIDGASAWWAGFLDQAEGADPSSSWLASNAGWIDDCFVGDDPVEILQRLKAHPEQAAQDTAATIELRAPMSVWIALRAVRRAATLPDVASVLKQDRTIAHSFILDSDDFVEGVRAKMVDKDNNPAWRHAHVSDVDPATVDAIFTKA